MAVATAIVAGVAAGIGDSGGGAIQVWCKSINAMRGARG